MAQLGLKCTQSLNLEEVKKYAMYLRVLAVAALVMRILWVFDIVQEVQKIVDDSKKAASAGASNGASSSGSPGTTANVPLDDSVVQSYTIQVIIVILILCN